jgi:hypothetical protein
MVVDNKRMHVSDCATKGASAFVFARTQKSPPPANSIIGRKWCLWDRHYFFGGAVDLSL